MGWPQGHTFWDTTTGQCLLTLYGHVGPVNSVFLSADGRHALSGSSDGTVELWDAATGKWVRTFDGQHGHLTTVNRWTSMITPVASLHQATGGDLARSLMWRDLLCRYQITDIAASVHRDRFGCWAALTMKRL